MASQTILDADTRFRGTLHTEDDLLVLGVVEGEVQAGGRVVIASGGLVHGPVRGREILVYGTVEGDVQAQGQFTLGASGKVEGDVRAAHMQMEDGGMLQGRVITESPGGYRTRERE